MLSTFLTVPYTEALMVCEYLQNGWSEKLGAWRLREAVIDGALDTAGVLLRAKVMTNALPPLIFSLRRVLPTTTFNGAIPQAVKLTKEERAALTTQLLAQVGVNPTLQAVVATCLAHVKNYRDVHAMLLHLTHISHMMQMLLSVRQAAQVPESFNKQTAGLSRKKPRRNAVSSRVNNKA